LALPQDPEELKIWEEGMLTEIAKQKTLEPSEAIPRLGLWLLQLNNNNGREEGGRPVFTAAKKTLLSIPGHAEYFGNRINEEREKLDRRRAEGKELSVPGAGAGDLSSAQERGLRILTYLPSVETVRVLGEFLSDERGAGNELSRSGDLTGEFPTHKMAMAALSKLPIANSPTGPITNSEQIADGLKSWRQWYSEVKEGRRTFRFIGDPVDYDLRGPSKRGAIGPQGDRTEKRPEPATAGTSPSVSQYVKEPGYLPYLSALGLLLGGLGYYIVKLRKKR